MKLSQNFRIMNVIILALITTTICHHKIIFFLLETATKLNIFAVPRRNVLSTMLSTSTVILFGSKQITLAEITGATFREYIDTFDGYSFLYPKSWIQVRGAGADIFFRDPFVLDENMSVEISSPSSSKYVTVEDLGPPEKAAERVLQQYLTEFMSTRLGVRRTSNILSASSKVADDGKLYYEVEVNQTDYTNSIHNAQNQPAKFICFSHFLFRDA
jgi:hypothetical protein